MVTFDHLGDDRDHVAMVFDPPTPADAPLVRIHSECPTGDVFGSLRCDCGEQLHAALHRFAAEGGVLLYLRQEGRGIGLKAKIDATICRIRASIPSPRTSTWAFRPTRVTTVSPRECSEALGIKRIRLLSSNPEKCAGLEAGGIEGERAGGARPARRAVEPTLPRGQGGPIRQHQEGAQGLSADARAGLEPRLAHHPGDVRACSPRTAVTIRAASPMLSPCP